MALANEPPQLEISVFPQFEHAIAGQDFTYTVVISNTGREPMPAVFVRVNTPDGTTLVDTHFNNPGWYVGGAQRGETGEIIWLTQEPFSPGRVATFELVVNVAPDMGGQQLVNEGYTAATASNTPIASGPPIRSQVLSNPAATGTPVPKASDVSAADSTATSTFASAPHSSPTTGATVPSLSHAESQLAASSKSPMPTAKATILLVGLSAFAVVTVGSFWLLRVK